MDQARPLGQHGSGGRAARSIGAGAAVTDLAVIETHPIQYHAPVYRELQAQFGISVTAIYGSDFSVSGYQDQEFATTFAWDINLLSGYNYLFLETIEQGGPRTAGATSVHGLREALDYVNPRAVLLTGYRPRFYRNAFRIAAKFSQPLLFRAETTDHAKKRGFLKRLLRDSALRYAYRRCSALLYVGERARQHYQRLGIDARQLIFSPYCVDTSVFRTSDDDRTELRTAKRAELGIEAHDIVLLFSGKLVPRKDPMCIIEAARLLAREERLVVVFLGSGALEPELRLAATIDPPVRARFVGFRNQRALSAYYHAADCLILPSVHDETWGLVVNEAQAHGLPCIVSDAVGCAPDLIQDSSNGAVFEHGNADDLAVAVRRTLPLLKNPAVRSRCREIVEAYSVTSAARGIAAAFEQVAPRV